MHEAMKMNEGPLLLSFVLFLALAQALLRLGGAWLAARLPHF